MTTHRPRPDRRDLLLGGTAALALLAAWSARSTPPALSLALWPYLAFVARHLLTSPRVDPAGPDPAAIPAGALAAPAPVAPRAEAAPEPESPPPVRAAAPRPRRRVRAVAVAEVAPAAWVEVAPGRFVRGETPEPAPPAGPEPVEAPGPIEPDPAPQPASVESPAAV